LVQKLSFNVLTSVVRSGLSPGTFCARVIAIVTHQNSGKAGAGNNSPRQKETVHVSEITPLGLSKRFMGADNYERHLEIQLFQRTCLYLVSWLSGLKLPAASQSNFLRGLIDTEPR
jgi:hypothetical protein